MTPWVTGGNKGLKGSSNTTPNTCRLLWGYHALHHKHNNMNTFRSNWNVLNRFWISRYFFTLLRNSQLQTLIKKMDRFEQDGWHGILRSNFKKFVTILLDIFNILVLHYLNHLLTNSTKIYKVRYFVSSHELRVYIQASMKSVKSTGWQNKCPGSFWV